MPTKVVGGTSFTEDSLHSLMIKSTMRPLQLTYFEEAPRAANSNLIRSVPH